VGTLRLVGSCLVDALNGFLKASRLLGAPPFRVSMSRSSWPLIPRRIMYTKNTAKKPMMSSPPKMTAPAWDASAVAYLMSLGWYWPMFSAEESVRLMALDARWRLSCKTCSSSALIFSSSMSEIRSFPVSSSRSRRVVSRKLNSG